MKIVRLLGATTLAASMLGTIAAHAQDPSKPAPAAPAATAPDPEAKKQFDAGVAYLEDPDGAKFEDAYRAFKKAYEISLSPKVLGNVGFCAMKLERDGEAIDAYATYLREVKEIDDRERKQIERDLTTMTATIARLKVSVKRPGSGFVLVDSREQVRGGAILNEYTLEGSEISLRVRPGRHTIKVRAGDDDSDAVVLTLDPGGTTTQEMKWTPKPVAVAAREPSSYVGPAILTSLGAAGIGAGIVTGLLAKDKEHNLRDSCNPPNNGAGADICPVGYDIAGKRTSAKTFRDISTTAFIAGPVVLGVGVVWGVVNYVRNKNLNLTRRGAADPSWLVGGMCAREGCSMNFTRGF